MITSSGSAQKLCIILYHNGDVHTSIPIKGGQGHIQVHFRTHTTIIPTHFNGRLPGTP